MKLLVTGATGFLGKEIVSELTASGNVVVEVGSTVGGRPTKKGEHVPQFRVDVSDSRDVNTLKAIKGVDAVIHAAGLVHQFDDVSKDQFYKVNVIGTANICELASALGAKEVLLISSVSVYGHLDENGTGIDESFECRPKGNYAESKFGSEIIARTICEKNDIALTILRPATIVGEGDAGNVARLIRTIDKGHFFWLGKGENSKSLIYKKDVAKACSIVLNRLSRGAGHQTEIFNVSAKALKVDRLVGIIEGSLGKRTRRIFLPLKVVRKILMPLFGFTRIRELQKLNASIEKWISNDVYLSNKIRDSYCFEPETSIEDALSREVKWYLENK